MAVYKNDYSKDEDFALWRLHEIRNKMTGRRIHPDEINKTARQIIHKYRLKKRIVSHVLPLSLAAIFLSAPFLFAQSSSTNTPNNTITLTTYYPAPFGAYDTMLLVRNH